MNTTTTSAPTAKKRPIRGALYGLILGIGLALIFIGRKIVTLDSIMPIVLIVVGIVIGVAWAMFGPAKGKGSAPAAAANASTASSSTASTASSTDEPEEAPDEPSSGDEDSSGEDPSGEEAAGGSGG